jgi:hypothetical protein
MRAVMSMQKTVNNVQRDDYVRSHGTRTTEAVCQYSKRLVLLHDYLP